MLPVLEEQQHASQPPQQLLAGHPPQLGQRVAAKNKQEEVKPKWLNQCLGRFAQNIYTDRFQVISESLVTSDPEFAVKI